MSAIGFQGEPGAFSEEAILALMGEVPTRGYRTLDDLVGAIDGGEIEFGLLPCENTIYGSIARTYDLIAEHPLLRVVAIGSALAAHRYGGQILAQAVQDPIENVTRFFLIARQGVPRRGLGRSGRVSQL